MVPMTATPRLLPNCNPVAMIVTGYVLLARSAYHSSLGAETRGDRRVVAMVVDRLNWGRSPTDRLCRSPAGTHSMPSSPAPWSRRHPCWSWTSRRLRWHSRTRGPSGQSLHLAGSAVIKMFEQAVGACHDCSRSVPRALPE